MDNPENEIDNYWKDNFNDDKIVNVGKDLQANIARTKKGKSVAPEEWTKTVHSLINILNINPESNVLELCCGNGVLLGELAPFCKHAVGVDYSTKLLSQFRERYLDSNLKTILADVRKFEIEASFFNTIIIYFSIQHFDERDAFLLIEKCIKNLKKNGQIYIGDIPDLERKWNYIDKKEYHQDYFKRVVNRTPKIGYWFQKDFFRAMNSCFPQTTFQIITQPNYQINSDHCFDILIKKNETK
jgi:ubiquinone/menaquinone biosynthesis C-methylase UbiE